MYHLFYADEAGARAPTSPSSNTRAGRLGRAGAGMVHRITFRVASEGALDFWEERLEQRGSRPSAPRQPPVRRPRGPRSRAHVIDSETNRWSPTTRTFRGARIRGFDWVRAYSSDAGPSRRILRASARLRAAGDNAWEVRGDKRGATTSSTRAGPARARGRGTVHHVAWASPIDEHDAWRERGRRGRFADAGDRPLLLQVDLLPRAERRALRDRHDRTRVHDRRAARAPGRAPLAAAELRAPARRARGRAHTVARPRAVRTG